MRRRSILVLLTGLVMLFPTVSALGFGGAPLSADLSGDNEVPPADPDGAGTAAVTLNPGHETVCWSITFEDIAAPTAAHIHAAPAGVNGGVVVTLDPNTDGCTDVDRSLILNIIRRPSDYYVNVHNAVYPGGAIRGQLSR